MTDQNSVPQVHASIVAVADALREQGIGKEATVSGGGNYKYLENGIKDCSNCLVPHSPKGYDYVTSKYSEILELAKKK